MMLTVREPLRCLHLRASGYRPPDMKLQNEVRHRVDAAAQERICEQAAPKRIKPKASKIVLSLEQRALKAVQSKDSLRAIDALLHEISWDELLLAARKKHGELPSLRSLAVLLADSVYSLPEPPAQSSILGTLISLCKSAIRKILHLLDAILSSLGIEDLFSHADNEFQASHKLQKIILLISILTGLLTLFAVSSINLETAFIIAGSILAAAALSALYIRYLKPAPTSLPCARNLSEEALSTTPKPLRRRGSLDLLATHLEREGELKRPVLITGPQGVGKTKLIEDLAKAICLGMYPKLKGKQLFYFNTADLIATSYSGGIWGDGDRVLQKILEAIGKHGEDTILVFDDIHTACKPGENYYFADRLKAYLDGKERGFSHFIAISSTEDYNRIVFPNAPWFEGKFHKMVLESADRQETIACLMEKVAEEPLSPLMEEGALQFLYEKVRESPLLSGRPEPFSSLIILERCLTAVEHSFKPLKQQAKLRLQQEMRDLVKAHSLSRGNELMRGGALKPWETTQSELQGIEALIEREQAQLNKLSSLKGKHEEATKDLLELAGRVSAIDENHLSGKQQTDSKKFLFLIGFYLPLLEKKLDKTAQSIDAEIKLTRDLILREIGKEEAAMQSDREGA
ncbi:AAA family ATPase [Estrella lausannensis]|uniref:Putative membrane protein n=1 Tax=Estrella lausannensis TaxID=483423 RepID=A0A0H5DRP7_9BACT|nr:AAA family ATPase [Estrella lausannensis]CRX38893.1 putative membrane protein [Estrella lausannensis]